MIPHDIKNRVVASLPFLRHRAAEETAGLPPLMIAAQRASASVLTGDHRQHKAGSGEKFWQFRKYDPGDRPQDIDWRQSAKGDHVFVRQKELQTTQTNLFWCASWEGMGYSSARTLPTKNETATILGLGLAMLMTRAGELVSFLESGMQPGRTDNTIMKIGQGFRDAHSESLPSTTGLKIPRHAVLILLGDFFDDVETIRANFTTLASYAAHATVIQVLDPAELDLPFAGRAIFESMTDNEKHHVAHVESVRQAYKTRLEDHLAQVKDICRSLNWDWVLHVTDQPPRDTLHKLWIRMADK